VCLAVVEEMSDMDRRTIKDLISAPSCLDFNTVGHVTPSLLLLTQLCRRNCTESRNSKKQKKNEKKTIKNEF
jgi:hypothetical protein